MDKKFVGSHVSISNGIQHSIEYAHLNNSKAFAMFLKSNRSWKSKPYTEKNITEFKQNLQKFNPGSAIGLPFTVKYHIIGRPTADPGFRFTFI